MAKEIDKIAALLGSDALEKQVAAAIVLGELKSKAPAVTKGLMSMLDSGMPPLQRHALDAFAGIGMGKATDKAFELLGARDDEVRQAAVRALATLGTKVVPKVKERLGRAGPREKQGLDSLLAQLGGKEAFGAILTSLHTADEDEAKTVALEVRHQLKEADTKTKRNYVTQVDRFLKLKKTQTSAIATATALKILGYLEDQKTIPTLLAHATTKKADHTVRQEALAALRFAAAGKIPKPTENKLIGALMKIAEGDDSALARTALFTLGTRELPATAAAKFGKLAAHPELERARFAIEQLGRQNSADATKALVGVLTTQDRVRAELASEQLKRKKDAAPLVAKALLTADDPDRAWMMQKVLRPNASKLAKPQRAQLLQRAVERLSAGKKGWEAPLQVVRDASPDAAADGLRDLSAKLLKGKKAEKAMMVARVLCRTDQATNDDRYRLAVIELSQGRRDTHPSARARDASLRSLEHLARDGFDVSKALLKDKLLDLETKYYIGFHFVEEGHPLGEDLLADVAKKGARTKIGKMAKNKLNLAMRDA